MHILFALGLLLHIGCIILVGTSAVSGAVHGDDHFCHVAVLSRSKRMHHQCCLDLSCDCLFCWSLCLYLCLSFRPLWAQLGAQWHLDLQNEHQLCSPGLRIIFGLILYPGRMQIQHSVLMFLFSALHRIFGVGGGQMGSGRVSRGPIG